MLKKQVKRMARNPKQDANLRPPFDSNQNREEASKNGRKGGKASGESRRAKRDARQAARYILGLAAKGQIKDNTKSLGAKDDDGITNMEALHARLYSMAISGNLDAYMTLMKIAGYDPKENRDERESIASDKRRMMELEAKLNALSGQVPEGASVGIGMGNEDGASDVVIYVPQMLSEEDCQVDDTEDTSAEGNPEEAPANQ